MGIGNGNLIGNNEKMLIGGQMNRIKVKVKMMKNDKAIKIFDPTAEVQRKN